MQRLISQVDMYDGVFTHIQLKFKHQEGFIKIFSLVFHIPVGRLLGSALPLVFPDQHPLQLAIRMF